MMTLGTIAKFFLFQADAHRRVMSCKSFLGVGAILVFSAAIAREYDGEYFIAEPWHLLAPMAASLFGCFILSLFVFVLSRCRKVCDISFVSMFLALLGAYWMTAPLAWLYAIPVERFLSEADATRANLWLLGIVSVSRVLLITRSISVLVSCRFWEAFIPVMLFSELLGFLAFLFVPTPIIVVMGGVRVSESEMIIATVRRELVGWGVLSFPVWFFGTIAIGIFKNAWRWTLDDTRTSTESHGVSRWVWGLSIVSILMWGPILVVTQAEQKPKWEFEQAAEKMDDQKLAELSFRYGPSSFPPGWTPPPAVRYGMYSSKLMDLTSAVLNRKPSHWMTEMYRTRFLDSLDSMVELNSLHLLSESGFRQLIELEAQGLIPDELRSSIIFQANSALQIEGRYQVEALQRQYLEQISTWKKSESTTATSPGIP